MQVSQNTDSNRGDIFDNGKHLQIPVGSNHFNNIKNNFNPGY